MTFDVLTQEFIALTDKIKALYEDREKKTAEFKELYLQHKAEVADIETQAKTLMADFETGGKKK